MPMAIPMLETERLLLTAPGPSAAEACARFHKENREHLQPWSPPMLDRHFDPAFWREKLESRAEEFRNGSGFSFCIFDRSEGAGGAVLGTLNFNEVVRGVFLACYMGYSLAENAQGKGLMTEACRAGIDFIFKQVRLHRIMANYIPGNVRSGAVLTRLGFTTEGTAKSYLYIGGAWQDHVLTSLTNPDPIVPSLGR
jgi:ribosomal-protein-alanine N-acetyltransferase